MYYEVVDGVRPDDHRGFAGNGTVTDTKYELFASKPLPWCTLGFQVGAALERGGAERGEGWFEGRVENDDVLRVGERDKTRTDAFS